MAMNKGSILCFGEAVWDLFPDQPRLGGAPLNVAVHLARQGATTKLLTAVGRDELGQQCFSFLEHEEISGALFHPRLPTGTVKVEVDTVDTPHFTIHDHAAWTDIAGAFLSGIPPLNEWVDLEELAVIVFGGLAMHSSTNRRLFERLMMGFRRAGLPLPTRLCDLNLRPGWTDPKVMRWCASHADILKVNEDERVFLEALEPRACPGVLASLLSRYSLQGLCTTLGPRGLQWMDALGNEIQLPAYSEADAPPVINTVGAGDAVTASIALGLSRKEPVQEFLERGRQWSAQVCGIPGAVPLRSPHAKGS